MIILKENKEIIYSTNPPYFHKQKKFLKMENKNKKRKPNSLELGLNDYIALQETDNQYYKGVT